MKIIDTHSWKRFKLSELFDISGSVTTPKNQLELDDRKQYPYITTAGTNNGVFGYSDIFTEEGNVLTVDSAVLGSTFYQEKNFTASDHVEKLIPKFTMTKNIALFITCIMNKNAEILGYAYNEKRSQKALLKEEISLPAVNDQPDFEYMENYIKSLQPVVSSSLTNLLSARADKKKIDTTQWKEFSYEDFFELKSISKKLDKGSLNDNGIIPVYSSETSNNGIVGYTSQQATFVIDASNPYYIIFGDHTRAFHIATSSFCVTDNVKVLKPKINNLNALRFITTVWYKNIQNMGYSRHWTIASKATLKLPVKHDGTPNFQYMENFILTLIRSNQTKINSLFDT